MHSTEQLWPSHSIVRHAFAPLHVIVHREPLAHVTLLQPFAPVQVIVQSTPDGHVKPPPGLSTMHTGVECDVSHELHCAGHGLLLLLPPLPLSTQ